MHLTRTMLLSLATLMLLTAISFAEKKPAATVITIEDLDCPVCAKKVVKTLTEVPGVAEVKIDVEKHTATVSAQAEKTPSPRAMWDAVERAGFKPTKLEGPGGAFTAKPRS